MDSVATSNDTGRSAVARVAGLTLVASAILGVAILRNSLLGALYVGYPVWALRLGRRLLAVRTEA